MDLISYVHVLVYLQNNEKRLRYVRFEKSVLQFFSTSPFFGCIDEVFLFLHTMLKLC